MINHDFLLLREGEVDYHDYLRFIRSKDDRVLIDDDAFWLLEDNLKWVPTLLPWKTPEPFSGLSQCGVTIVAQAGAAIFGKICAAWADLLACGPEEIGLRGAWTKTAFAPGRTKVEELRLPPPVPEDNVAYITAIGGEGYATISLLRDPIVSSLRALAEYGAKAATGEYFILHLGI